MTFEAEFLELMPHTFTVRKFTALSTDGYAARTHSTGVLVRGLFAQERRLVRDLQGREVLSVGACYLSPFTSTSGSAVVDPQDEIVLPSGFTVAGSSEPPIIAVERYTDETGAHHNTVVRV